MPCTPSSQAREIVEDAQANAQESEDDWEANAESWEDLDAVPAIGPAAEKARQKVRHCCFLHLVSMKRCTASGC